MILIINNSNKEIKHTTWNLKLLYVINALLQNDRATLVNTDDEMNKYILNNKQNINGIILTGSELRICQPQMLDKILDNILPILELNVPVLGICFGMQMLGLIYQAKIGSFNKLLKGYVNITVNNKSKIFSELDLNQKVFVEHNDWLKTKPMFFNVISKNSENIIYGIEHTSKPIFGLQFHPEFSPNGIQIYRNFLKICSLKTRNLKYKDVKEVYK